MTDQFSSPYDQNNEKGVPDDPSSLLEELAQIRKDLEHDSMVLRSKNKPSEPTREENANRGLIFESVLSSEGTNEQNHSNKASQTPQYRSFYRFDLEHVEHNLPDTEKNEWATDSFSANSEPLKWEPLLTKEPTEIDFSLKNLDKGNQKGSHRNVTHSAHTSGLTQKNDELSQKSTPNDVPSSELPQTSKKITETSKPTEDRHDHRYDDAPVVIPINRGDNVRKPSRGSSRPGRPQNVENRERHVIRAEKQSAYPYLPWQAISRYESEALCRFATNASTFSLFIGWGAIACGILIFVRSFFVGSMIWLNYGLPVLSLGAVCLFLGIILSILSEKMQQINELKQSLTVQRITGKSDRKFDLPHQGYAPDHEHTTDNIPVKKTVPAATQTTLSTEVEDLEELEDVYERLVKLRSEIDSLINECENSDSIN